MACPADQVHELIHILIPRQQFIHAFRLVINMPKRAFLSPITVLQNLGIFCHHYCPPEIRIGILEILFQLTGVEIL